MLHDFGLDCGWYLLGVDEADIQLDIDEAVPCSLLVWHEMVRNAAWRRLGFGGVFHFGREDGGAEAAINVQVFISGGLDEVSSIFKS
jgi:hypothetical protein